MQLVALQRKALPLRSIGIITTRRISDTELRIYGKKKQTPVSLKSLLETGAGKMLDQHPVNTDYDKAMRIRFQIACFLHRELPVRLGSCFSISYMKP